jgi:hypothetical protein
MNQQMLVAEFARIRVFGSDEKPEFWRIRVQALLAAFNAA